MGAARWVRLFGVFLLILAVYFLVPVNQDAHGGPVLRAVLAAVVFVGLAAAVLVQVRLSLEDEDRRLDGLVTAIVAVWVVFALTFQLLAGHQPDQLEGLRTKVDALYFSASTMLTIGYGDVHAIGQLARALVLLQMLFDVVFVATAAGTLSAHVRRRAQGWNTQRKPR